MYDRLDQKIGKHSCLIVYDTGTFQPNERTKEQMTGDSDSGKEVFVSVL